MAEEYININKIAEIKGLTSNRSLRLAIQKGKYVAREVKVFGGTSYEILYSSLELEVQEKLQDELIKEATQSNCTALVSLDTTPKYPTFIAESAKLTFNYHDPLMTRCVDKCSFKDYIKETVGEKYVVPLYGVWENVNDINFDALPNKFAIKSTWGWGDLQNILVKNKKNLNVHRAKAMLSNWLQEWNNYYYQSFEWDSKDIKPRIIAEMLLEPSSGEIIDYKFYCYHGKCRHFLICKDRKTKIKYINYDLDFNCIKLSPNSYVVDTKFKKNALFDEMLAMAEKLSKPFPLVRVDFYDVDGKLYVGELTFSPGGGFNTYYEEWDNKLGGWLDLNKIPVENLKLLPGFIRGAKNFLDEAKIKICSSLQ